MSYPSVCGSTESYLCMRGRTRRGMEGLPLTMLRSRRRSHALAAAVCTERRTTTSSRAARSFSCPGQSSRAGGKRRLSTGGVDDAVPGQRVAGSDSDRRRPRPYLVDRTRMLVPPTRPHALLLRATIIRIGINRCRWCRCDSASFWAKRRLGLTFQAPGAM